MGRRLVLDIRCGKGKERKGKHGQSRLFASINKEMGKLQRQDFRNITFASRACPLVFLILWFITQSYAQQMLHRDHQRNNRVRKKPNVAPVPTAPKKADVAAKIAVQQLKNSQALAAANNFQQREMSKPKHQPRSFHFGHRHQNASYRHKACRSFDQLGQLPWTQKISGFYNFGIPLSKRLCGLQVVSSVLKEACDTVKGLVWQTSSFSEARTSSMSSTVLVDPPLVDDGGASSGIFTISAIYSILVGLGYKVRVRNWSASLNEHFSNDVVESAMRDSTRWNDFLALSNASKRDAVNPFHDVTDYIAFQTEVGLHYWKHPPPDIIDSPHTRELRWIIGHQKRSHDPHYQTHRSHCVGANFFLGESLRCAASSVIMCPMFPFHHDEGTRYSKRADEDKGFFWKSKVQHNILLIDNDAGSMANKGLKDVKDDLAKLGLTNAVVHVHRDRKRHLIPSLYKNIKLTIDCNNPGVEFINYESTLYYVLNLACNSRATRNMFDFPVPSRYRIEPSNREGLMTLVHELLVNYTDYLDDFQHFRRLSQQSSSLIPNQLDIHLFSRDVLFRTFCNTFAECRHVVPWALSIWVLYPLARIEIFTGIPSIEFEMDNDAVLHMFPDVFIANRFVKIIQWVSEESAPSVPVFVRPSFPCTHVMFMSPHFVLFGRDFLNEHMRALALQRTPIVHYRGSSVHVAFFRAEMSPPITYWADNSKGIFEMYVIENEKRYLIDWDAFVTFGYHHLLHTRASTQAEVLKYPLGGNRQFKPDGLNGEYWGSMLRSYSGPPLPFDMLFIREGDALTSAGMRAGEEEGGGAVTSVAELWLVSSVAPINVGVISSKFRSVEVETIVSHLDPILQSTYFKKALHFFPIAVQNVFHSFSAVNHPHVLSLRDAYYPHWGEHCDRTTAGV